METNSTQQEILLFTETRFSSRQWSQKDETNKENKSHKEQLEEACWNGLIWEILPEICETPNNRALILWEIHVADSFLELKFSERPRELEKEFSVDPYVFMETKLYN
jgi:hypothetical protein